MVFILSKYPYPFHLLINSDEVKEDIVSKERKRFHFHGQYLIKYK